MTTHVSVAITINPGEVTARRVPSVMGDFHVLEIGSVSVHVITRADLDALVGALDKIRAGMEMNDMTPGELIEVYGK